MGWSERDGIIGGIRARGMLMDYIRIGQLNYGSGSLRLYFRPWLPLPLFWAKDGLRR